MLEVIGRFRETSFDVQAESIQDYHHCNQRHGNIARQHGKPFQQQLKVTITAKRWGF